MIVICKKDMWLCEGWRKNSQTLRAIANTIENAFIVVFWDQSEICNPEIKKKLRTII
jgi:hypothetical protein